MVAPGLLGVRAGRLQVLDLDVQVHAHLRVARAGRPDRAHVRLLGLERQPRAAVGRAQLDPVRLVLDRRSSRAAADRRPPARCASGESSTTPDSVMCGRSSMLSAVTHRSRDYHCTRRSRPPRRSPRPRAAGCPPRRPSAATSPSVLRSTRCASVEPSCTTAAGVCGGAALGDQPGRRSPAGSSGPSAPPGCRAAGPARASPPATPGCPAARARRRR